MFVLVHARVNVSLELMQWVKLGKQKAAVVDRVLEEMSARELEEESRGALLRRPEDLLHCRRHIQSNRNLI